MPARTSSFADDNEVNRSLMARALQLFGRPRSARARPPAPAVRRRPKWTHAATSVIKGRPRRGVGSRRRQPAGEATVFFPSSCSSEARSVSELLDCLSLSLRSTRGSFRHLLISNYDFVK